MHHFICSVLPIPISYRYRRRYLHVADLSLSVVGIYGCVADVTRTCTHMVQCSFASLLPEFSHVKRCEDSRSYSDGKEVESMAIFHYCH